MPPPILFPLTKRSETGLLGEPPFLPGVMPALGQSPSAISVSTGPYLRDRVKETTTTTGTDTLSLLGVGTFNGDTFVNAVGSGNSILYEIVHQTLSERETGYGIVTAGVGGNPDTLYRDPNKVTGGSNGTSLVNFSAGTKDVFITIPSVIVSPPNTYFNVKAFGAKGDVALLTDGVMTAGSPVLTCPSGPFRSTDPGKSISVQGPGAQGNTTLAGVGANYVLGTIISYQSPTQVTLSISATITLSGCPVLYGTDDGAAINAAMSAANANGGGTVYLPAGTYFVGQAVIWYSYTHILGSGVATTILMLRPGATNDIITSSGFASLTGRNLATGPHSCSLRDITLNGYYYHGGFMHTQLSAALAPADTTATVLSTAGFPTSGLLSIYGDGNDSGEIVQYTGTTATTFTGLTRGVENTVRSSSSIADSVDLRATGGVFNSGYGLRVYAYDYILENIRIHDCQQDGWYSEWSTAAGNLDPDSMPGHFLNVKVHHCVGHGINFGGPHDSQFVTGNVYLNNMIAVRLNAGAAGTQISNFHVAGKQVYGMFLNCQTEVYNCLIEQAVYGQVKLLVSQTIVIACKLFGTPSDGTFVKGLLIGDATTNVSQCVVDILVSGCLGGSIDWTGDGGNNYVRANIQQNNPGGGNLFIDAPNVSSTIQITSQFQNFTSLTSNQNIVTAPSVFRNQSAGSSVLAIRKAVQQSANWVVFQDSGGVAIDAIDKYGNLGINKGTPTFGLHQVGGSQRLVGLGTTTTPTGTAFGGSGTNADYYVVAKDSAGLKSLVSAKVTISGGAALSASVWNRISFTAPSSGGAYTYDILKTDTATLLATVTPNSGGNITRVTVTAGGSGYTGSAPLIGFSGPINNMPLATATVSGNAVTAITMSSSGNGRGFTSVPSVVIGGPGSGAAATANMGAANMTSIGAGGSGYVVNDTVTLTGGTFATATVLVVTGVTGGAITSIAVKTQGSYSVLPANPVAQGSTSGVGTAATFNIDWGIASCTVTNGGINYSSAPSIGFNGGGALPTSIAILAANAVSGISISAGSGLYTGAPTVVVQGVAAGSGCTATASLATLSYDDIGGGTSAYVAPLRDATADATVDGSMISSDVMVAPYMSTSKEFLRHYDSVTSAAATLALMAGIARTVTSAVAASNQKNVRGEWLRISATTTGAVSSLVAATFTETQMQAGPVFVTRVEIPTAIVNMRVMIGLTSAAMVQTTDTQSTLHTLYFRYSTNTSDTKWQCCSSNASATTVIDSGIVVAADTVYKLRIDCTDNTRIKFYINDTLVAVATATLPTATTGIAPEHSLTSLTNTGQKDLDTAYTAIWQ